MPQVTNLKQQKNNDNRFNVYIDGKFAFGLSSYLLEKYGIEEGENISDDDLEEIVVEENKEKLKDKVLDYISGRPRSGKEITDYLYKKLNNAKSEVVVNKQDKLVNEIKEFLKKYDYLDDKKFADWMIKQRKSQGKGPRYIQKDTYKKGVKKDVYKEVLKNYDFTEALEKSYKKALKKYKKEENEYKKRQKIYRYLAYRGFTYDQIQDVVD